MQTVANKMYISLPFKFLPKLRKDINEHFVKGNKEAITGWHKEFVSLDDDRYIASAINAV